MMKMMTVHGYTSITINNQNIQSTVRTHDYHLIFNDIPRTPLCTRHDDDNDAYNAAHRHQRNDITWLPKRTLNITACIRTSNQLYYHADDSKYSGQLPKHCVSH